MHCCLGNWFKKKLAQSFHTCSYQHWQRLPSEPRLPISAPFCQVKVPSKPPQRECLLPRGSWLPIGLGCALCLSLSGRTSLQWHLVYLLKSEQLRTTEIDFSCFWMVGVWNHRVCESVLPLDTRGKIWFLSLPAHGGSGNFILTLVSVITLLPHFLYVDASPCLSLSYDTGYLMKMLNGITDTKVFFQMRLWSHVLGNGM